MEGRKQIIQHKKAILAVLAAVVIIAGVWGYCRWKNSPSVISPDIAAVTTPTDKAAANTEMIKNSYKEVRQTNDERLQKVQPVQIYNSTPDGVDALVKLANSIISESRKDRTGQSADDGGRFKGTAVSNQAE